MADNRAFAKIDVGWAMNRKWFTVERELRHAMPDAMPDALLHALHQAMHAHLVSILYCSQQRSDGIFPVDAIKQYGRITSEPAITALFEVGLWINHPGGMAEVRDYLEHQPSSEELDSASQRARKAAAARWSKNATGNAKRNAPSNASGNASGNAEKSREEKSISRETRPDVFGLLDHFDAQIVAIDYKKPSRTKTNIAEMRKLLDTDKRSVEEIKQVIDYATNSWWTGKVRSPLKLRKNYETLLAQIRERQPSTPAPAGAAYRSAEDLPDEW